MATLSSLLSWIILAIFSTRHFFSLADPRTNFVARLCNKMRVDNVTNYFKYYTNISDSMQQEMYRNKFAFKDAGDPPDQLHMLSQCMEDLSPDECVMCFTQITTLIPGCFPYAGVRIYLDGCFIRADNYSFYPEATGPEDTKKCGDDINPGQEFKDAVENVLNRMLKKAPHSEGFALSQHNDGDVSAYGLAACWRTLDRDLCSTCLSAAVASALTCLPATEARVLNTGCFLHYSNTAFANDPGMETSEEIFPYIVYLMGVILVCMLAIGLGVCLGKITYRRKNRRKEAKGMEEDVSLDGRLQCMQFRYATLEIATDNFGESRRLGRGGFGEVYKGILPDGREIAIKRLFASRKSRLGEISNEIDIISRSQHKNLVRFLGCCFTKIDSFLVYEYLANRSLDLLLFDPERKKELDWKKRLLIIIGTAEGLEYLHEDCQVRIIHRDIKASNVLLDLKHKPKISDFGLARFSSCDQSIVNTAIAGTLGYMAPEYIAKGRLTEKVDVYSFGVLVIEIVSGVENTKFNSEEAYETLVTWAWNHFQKNEIREIVDRSMELEDVEEVKRVVQIGLLCTQESPSLRPTMTKVVQMLRQRDLQLPTPSKPPFTDEDMQSKDLFDNLISD